MSWRTITAILTALGAIAGGCAELSDKYSVEIHVSRVWGVDEALPERLTR